MLKTMNYNIVMALTSRVEYGLYFPPALKS
jgi:hypothetical protein